VTEFSYAARSEHGMRVRGTMESESRSAALSALRSRALTVTVLERRATARGFIAALACSGRVSHRTTVPFFRSLAEMVRAGVPLRRCLEIAIEQCKDARFAEALRSALSDIEHGMPLSEAMSRRPADFSGLFVAMLRAGEISGQMDDVLERLAAVLEREHASRKRLASALIYPIVVALCAAGLVLFLLSSIVPMFSSMYAQLRVPLPAATSLLLQIGTALQSPGVDFGIIAAFAACAALAVHGAATESGKALRQNVMDGVPVIGTLMRKSAVARLCRLLGTLLRSGVNILSAIDVLQPAVGHVRYAAALGTARAEISAGSGVAAPLLASGLFEPLFLQLVRVGEETGALDAMLLRLAEYYELDVETTLASLGALLEPAMILTLGGAVGFIVAAIFIPLYTLIGNIK